MAQVCSTCLNVVDSLTRGMCPTCHQANDHTRRPPARHRYPAEYHRNRTILLRGGPPCHWCGDPATTADHLTPRAHGGGHGLDNLVPACAPCNTRRGAWGQGGAKSPGV